MRFSLCFSFGRIKVQLRAASYPLVVVFQRELTAAIIHDHYRIRLQTNACWADANMRFDSKVVLVPQCTPAACVYLCFHSAYTLSWNLILISHLHATKQEHPMTRDISLQLKINKYLINYTRAAVFYKRCTASVTCSGYSSFSTDRSDNSRGSFRGVGISMRSNWDAFCQGAGWSIFWVCEKSEMSIVCHSVCAHKRGEHFMVTNWVARENCADKTTVCWRGNDNFTWKGYHANENMYEGKNCFWCGLHSLSPPLEGQVMKCTRSKDRIRIAPFLWASWKFVRDEVQLALVASSYASMMFLECALLPLFHEKWAQLCDAALYKLQKAYKFRPILRCQLETEANSRKERGKINGNYALCKTLKVHDSGQLYYACSRQGVLLE